VFKVFEVRNRVQVFGGMFVSFDFTMLSGFNASGHTANSHIVLACNLKMFRMV